MRHRVKNKRLGRSQDHRKAVLRNLTTSLFIEKKVRTTKARAKELSRFADKIFTSFRKKDLANGIRFLKTIFTNKESSKSFIELNDKLSNVKAGFTRITSIGFRPGDSSEIVQVEFCKK